MSESSDDLDVSPSKGKEPKRMNSALLITLSIISVAIQMPLLFLPAGRWDWIEAWIYLIIYFIFMTSNVLILNKKNPEVLINRMKTKKERMKGKKGSDKWLFPLISIVFIGLFLLPAFDFRYGWSNVPVYIEIGGFLLLAIAFYILFRSMRDNAYASKVLDVRKDSGHKVIDTGTYAIVRHPMYTGFSIMGFGLALGLGSWWTLILAISAFGLLALRITFEEKMLSEELEGYLEYKKKVKYKLIPKIY
ncbi:MAG: isoprenylcysteine carboxylmethyltransferase family protein [Promethearchaeota archaeon]|nr:MAG: isoprenylcysteine carboxylmethyltransferase family protein [Candidatus Lokiarchaeota archaeon]